jgi:RNA polymerase sigma-70 factor (ECF subfamily)
METGMLLQAQKTNEWADEEIVARVLSGETALFEIIMRRYNQRLYRVARGILRNDGEAEDVMQDAYVRAYQHLGQFAGRSKFSTWLTRIAVHEALARLRKQSRFQDLEPATSETSGEGMENLAANLRTPEQNAGGAELRSLLEQAIASLPENYRAVLMLRDVEEMTTQETAEALELTEENVKVRLHRARAMMRRELYGRVGASSASAFQFEAPRCDRVVAAVFARLATLGMAPISVH